MWQIYVYWDMLIGNHTDDKPMWQIYAYWDITNLWLPNILSGNHTDDKSMWQIYASWDMLTGNYLYDKFIWQLYDYWICWVATTQMINLCDKSMLTGVCLLATIYMTNLYISYWLEYWNILSWLRNVLYYT